MWNWAQQQRGELSQVLKLFTRSGRAEIAQARGAFQDLMRAFFADGGLTVETPCPPAKVREGPVVIRTVIQADGDLLTILSSPCLENPEHWERHLAAVRSELEYFQSCIAKLADTFGGMAGLVSVPVAALEIYPIWESEWSGLLKTVLCAAAWPVTLAILRWLARAAGLYWLRRKLGIRI